MIFEAYRSEFSDISFTLSDVCVCERLDFTITDTQSSEEEGILDYEFEDVSQGEEGKVGHIGFEDVVEEVPD